MTSENKTPETRQSLILRLRNPDDIRAWHEFAEVYQPLIRSLAIRFGLQKADSDDVTQEVLTRVAKYVENWDSKSENASFRGWLATITRNQTMEFFRERSRRPTTGADSQIHRLQITLKESDFDLEHARQLFVWAARRVQTRFETKTWEAFWLTTVEEMTASDCAKKLDTSVAQVYVSRSRVMKALKRAVEHSEFEFKTDWRVS